MKILYNKIDEKEINALVGFEPAHDAKRMDFLMVASLSIKVFMLVKNCFLNSQTCLLTIPPKMFSFQCLQIKNEPVHEFPTMWCVRLAKPQISLRIRAV